jgi:septum formation protein
MIRAFEDRSHKVLTGVALVWRDEADPWRPVGRDIFVDRAAVTLGRLDERALEAYVDSGLWRGKAGAYNYEERVAEGWPLSCDGDPTGVMGLPMRALVRRLGAR